MTDNAKVETEGADLFYDVEGSGPVLLTVAGGGGDGARYAGISRVLKDEFTVVRYDRRCCSRSTGNVFRALDIAQQARDAVAILRDIGASKAYIFGNSGGGAIACKIAEDHPQVVAGMVVHEPSILPVLPDAAEWLSFNAKVQAVYHAQGVGPAMMLFATSLRGFDNAPNAPGHRIGDRQSDGNLDFFLAQEMHGLSHYYPDMDRIRRSKLGLIAAAGKLSGEVYYARTAKVLAEAVGCPFRVMAGHHIGFVQDPMTFGAELRDLFQEIQAMAKGVAGA